MEASQRARAVDAAGSELATWRRAPVQSGCTCPFMERACMEWAWAQRRRRRVEQQPREGGGAGVAERGGGEERARRQQGAALLLASPQAACR